MSLSGRSIAYCIMQLASHTCTCASKREEHSVLHRVVSLTYMYMCACCKLLSNGSEFQVFCITPYWKRLRNRPTSKQISCISQTRQHLPLQGSCGPVCDMLLNICLSVQCVTSPCVVQVVDLSGNQISSLRGLQDHPFLMEINLEENKVRLGERDHPFLWR